MFVRVYVTFAPAQAHVTSTLKESQLRSGNFLLEDLDSVACSLISTQRLVAPVYRLN